MVVSRNSRTWFLAVSVLGLSLSGFASVNSGQLWRALSPGHLTTGAVAIVNFAPLEEADVHMQCGSSQAPLALATPHPSLAGIPDNTTITVNFIIGADGQVYSPFVLDGAGPALDRKVVETVRGWRYRPALCNGVPTDAEVKVQLSSR
jgi:TonB family protein